MSVFVLAHGSKLQTTFYMKPYVCLKKKDFKPNFGEYAANASDSAVHCDYCLKNKVCAFKDDMFELYPLLKDAEGIIFATPVYNNAASAQLKAVLDRCRAAVASDKNFFKGKIGMGIALGGDRNGGQEHALMQITNFEILNGMIPVSGGFFGANMGATFWTKDTLEGVKQDEEGFRSLKKTVKKFSDLLAEKKVK